jgi:hypothetical protein
VCADDHCHVLHAASHRARWGTLGVAARSHSTVCALPIRRLVHVRTVDDTAELIRSWLVVESTPSVRMSITMVELHRPCCIESFQKPSESRAATDRLWNEGLELKFKSDRIAVRDWAEYAAARQMARRAAALSSPAFLTLAGE